MFKLKNMPLDAFNSILVTTIPGLEDIVLDDLKNTVNFKEGIKCPNGLRGKVLIKGVSKVSLERLLKLRSIERIIMLLGSTKIAKKREGLHAIYKYCLKLPFEYFITPHTRIAVISQREGNQEYTSLDISRVVGQAIIDRIINEYGIRPPVDLDYPDIAIYAEVMNDTFMVGIDTTWPYALHNRDYRKYIHPSSLRPTIAYALVKLSRAKDKELILDPMCGGGTILIEATLTFPHLKAFGMDINQVFVKGAFKNVSAAGVKGRVILKVGDARILDKEFPNVEFDRIITDPPYGIRMRPRGLKELYERFLRSSLSILRDNGTLTLITIQRRLTLSIASKLHYRTVHLRKIYQGGLYSYVIVLEKHVS